MKSRKWENSNIKHKSCDFSLPNPEFSQPNKWFARFLVKNKCLLDIIRAYLMYMFNTLKPNHPNQLRTMRGCPDVMVATVSSSSSNNVMQARHSFFQLRPLWWIILYCAPLRHFSALPITLHPDSFVHFCKNFSGQLCFTILHFLQYLW